MSDWTSGYVSDIGYTFGYYGELNPARLSLALISQGIVPPQVRTACELGFGQGLSANLHAAASGVEWHGTDFNPSQAAFAREMAAHAGVGAQWRDDAFADFCNRPDLPEFDFIGLHGIWSWISDDNRRVIVDFVRRKLRVGGVLYISYNTLPGWAAFAPMRHLMVEHAEVLGAEGRGIVSRINGAIDFAERLLGTNPMFSRANPQVGERLQKMKEHNRQYLAHEYFNRDWHPMHFATMAHWLEHAKVQFAGSANLMDTIEVVNLTADQQTFLKEIPDPLFRQSVRDFMVNQQFRRDYWVKGARTMTPLDQTEALRSVRVVLLTHRPDVPMKIQGALGEATLQENVYAPVLDLLADHKVHSVESLEIALASKGAGLNFAQLVQCLTLLMGNGHLAPVQADGIIKQARTATGRVNEWLTERARSSSDIHHLASPVTGGGVTVPRFQQLFLRAVQGGLRNQSELAAWVWQVLSTQGQRLVKEGKALESDQANLEELTQQAQVFLQKQWPILKSLGVA